MDEQRRRFRACFADVVDSDEFDWSTKLNDIEGWQSLTSVDFMVRAFDEFGVELHSTDFDGLETVEDLYAMTMSKD